MNFYQIICDWIKAEIGNAECPGPLYKYSCCMEIFHKQFEPDQLNVVFRSYVVCILKTDICVSSVDDFGYTRPADPDFFNKMRHLILRSCNTLNFMLDHRTVPAQLPTIIYDGRFTQPSTHGGGGVSIEHWCGPYGVGRMHKTN